MKAAVPLLCATCVAIAGLAAIALLIWHASDARDAHDSLDDVTVEFNALQGIPWKLVTPSGGSRAQVQAQLSAAEASISRDVAQLRHESPAPGFEAAVPQLAANFRIQQQLLDLIAAGKVADTGRLGYAAFQTGAAVTRDFNRASDAYLANAHDALIEGTVGSAVVILALLGGFGAFFWRSFRARASAEALADALRRSEAYLTQAQQVARIGTWAWDENRRQLTWSAENTRLHCWRRISWSPTTGPESRPS